MSFKGKTFDITTADAQPPVLHGPPGQGGPAATSATCSRTPFSADALGKMETAMQVFRGDNDEILDVSPDTILIPDIAS